ncbi:NAD(P)/FAD-dependent oxidoreductase [Phytopseudomonas dryadis]|uniref:FAD-dependent oxidoreductase n=1 Tax=Phytopseudomonas dryadis TaxID=2487520 RepID=A0A4Q9R5M6_9GAMM|nr:MULTISPECIES: FAD-binding oxidoreductase [Pseudomonas]TBU95847.1 FAD-dependent oxidoreductase [Pseudomonas dryadis]TBV09010.1 FAD-dependent oxidoreductase [Pseudomonas dryadis]TBV18225.1 FAD-dependent oxidoreductase [Pseudomonas sp. FRB 230]
MRTTAVSLWMDQVAQFAASRPSLDHALELDIAIIGAGYTGLWTAWYLKQHAPQLRIAIFEARQVGHGASGRNGGWLLGRITGLEAMLQNLPRDERHALLKAVQQIPDDVEQALRQAQIDCGYRKGGVLACAARYPEQWQWLQEEIKSLHAFGYSEDDYRLLSASELAGQIRVNNAYGGMFSPHCATIQPAQLALGLASTLEGLGVRIYENSRAEKIGNGQLNVAGHPVKANWIVPCVEGYAMEFPPLGRYQLAVQSLQIATAPLSEAQWAEIGLANGQAAHECSRQVSYFHRSRDNRLVFGARGSYRFGGRLREDFRLSEAELALRRNIVLDLFPQLAGTPIEYGWGGNLGMTRHFRPYVLCDQPRNMACAGGYGGEGVGGAYLAGRTLADLILGRDTLYARAPWVTRRSLSSALKRWEPEPFRWLGYGGISAAYSYEDALLSNPHSAPWQRKMATALAVGVSHLVSPDVKVG